MIIQGGCQTNAFNENPNLLCPEDRFSCDNAHDNVHDGDNGHEIFETQKIWIHPRCTINTNRPFIVSHHQVHIYPPGTIRYTYISKYIPPGTHILQNWNAWWQIRANIKRIEFAPDLHLLLHRAPTWWTSGSARRVARTACPFARWWNIVHSLVCSIHPLIESIQHVCLIFRTRVISADTLATLMMWYSAPHCGVKSSQVPRPTWVGEPD